MFTLNCKGRLVVVDKPLVMGIVNLTPDSFFAGSRLSSEEEIIAAVEKMLRDGASIIDIGGQSTRPGSQRVSEKEELGRVIKVIEKIRKKIPDSIISIDTYYSAVAEQAIAAGASIINDVTAGSVDPRIIKVAADNNVPYVLMHMKGSLENMQSPPAYDDVTKEVLDFFIKKTAEYYQQGVYQVIIDPGFGFGKSANDNYRLLNQLSVFKMLGKPILAGLSRKSTISRTLNIKAEDSLNGTTVLNTVALLHGASILRVHDVKEAAEAVKLIAALKSPNAE